MNNKMKMKNKTKIIQITKNNQKWVKNKKMKMKEKSLKK